MLADERKWIDEESDGESLGLSSSDGEACFEAGVVMAWWQHSPYFKRLRASFHQPTSLSCSEWCVGLDESSMVLVQKGRYCVHTSIPTGIVLAFGDEQIRVEKDEPCCLTIAEDNTEVFVVGGGLEAATRGDVAHCASAFAECQSLLTSECVKQMLEGWFSTSRIGSWFPAFSLFFATTCGESHGHAQALLPLSNVSPSIESTAWASKLCTASFSSMMRILQKQRSVFSWSSNQVVEATTVWVTLER